MKYAIEKPTTYPIHDSHPDHRTSLRIGAGLLVLLGLLIPSSLYAQPLQGTLTGIVMDAQSSKPISGAAIRIENQPALRVFTDSEGRYEVQLAPGMYVLEVSAPGYLPMTLREVEVKPGQVTDASTVLALSTAVTKVDVVEKITPVAATAEAMLAERQMASVVTDALSSEELRRSVASDAAAAAQKITGVSVVGAGYVYVRGLGDRYSATTLNRALIPTTEPEKRVVPLDLFPATLIDNIRVLKTYSPDMPGEFSAGLIELRTVDFPSRPIFQVSFSNGFNTRTTFNPFLTYPGGRRDFFGFDDGARALPPQIPNDKRLFPGTFSPQQFQTFGQAFSNQWEPVTLGSMRPQQKFSMVGGATRGRLGVVGAFTFSNQPIYQKEIQRYIRQEGKRPVVFTNYEDFDSYTESARMGGVLNLAFRLTAAHKFVVRNTYTHDTDKEARQFAGYDGTADTFLKSERLRWVERGLWSTSFEGDHALAGLHNSLIRWQLTYARAYRDEPDMREVIRGLAPGGQFVFAALSSSGQRFFNWLDDRIWDPQIELATPFYRGSVSGMLRNGFRATLRRRHFQARRFRFIPQRLSTLPLTAPSNQLFAPANIRPDGFQLVEFTRATDRYDADMQIYAGYSMVELALGHRWRFIGGLRIEDAQTTVETLDPLVPNARPVGAYLSNRDPVTGLNLIYALTPKQNLRFGYSHTLSRPDFRELSPFDFNNVYGGFVVQGNPNLVRATVHNWDVRWEWFLGGNQLLAAGAFAKTFRNPIEATILPSNDLRQTFVNARGAVNRGIELESRTGLGRLHPKLREFALVANFTFVASDIRIREEDARLVTSLHRPLVGQSRYIVNAIAEWIRPRWRSQARFDASYVSRRLSDVGTFGVPDIYQEGNTFLDFVYQYSLSEGGTWVLKFSAENLADNHFRWTQGDILQRSYRLGRTFGLGLNVNF
jgi:outer membrane receptor protein involved in Fe transport